MWGILENPHQPGKRRISGKFYSLSLYSGIFVYLLEVPSKLALGRNFQFLGKWGEILHSVPLYFKSRIPRTNRAFHKWPVIRLRIEHSMRGIKTLRMSSRTNRVKLTHWIPLETNDVDEQQETLISCRTLENRDNVRRSHQFTVIII